MEIGECCPIDMGPGMVLVVLSTSVASVGELFGDTELDAGRFVLVGYGLEAQPRVGVDMHIVVVDD